MKKLILLFVIWLTGVGVCFADGDYLGDLGVVVVTPTGSDRQVAFIPANVKVITAEDIENSFSRVIPDLLRNESSIVVSDLTGAGNNVAVDMLGFGETAQSNVLLMIDGRRMDSVDIVGTNWQQISIDEIERIEVIRGSGSVLYGDNSNAGVINIITKKGGGDLSQEVSFWNSSYRGLGGRLALSSSARGISYRVNSYGSVSDGYRENTNLSIRGIGGRIGYSIGELVGIELNTGYHYSNYGLPGALLQTDLDGGMKRTDAKYIDDSVISDDSYIHSIISVEPYEDVTVSLKHSYRQKLSVADWVSIGGSNKREDYRSAIGLKLNWNENIFDMDNRLTIGYDYDFNNLKSKWLGSYPSKDRVDVMSMSGYMIEEFSPIRNLMLNAGLRHQITEYEFDPEPAWEREMKRSETAYNLGISWLFRSGGKVYVNYSNSFRFPKTDEVIAVLNPDTFITSYEELEVQKSKDFQVGFHYHPLYWIMTGVHYYGSNLKNEIYYDPYSSTNKNYDDTRRSVIEIETEVKPLDWISLRMGYSIVSAEFIGGKYEGNSIPGVPEYKATVNCNIQPLEKFSLNLSMQNTGKRYFISDQKNEKDRLSDFTRVDVGLNYTLSNFDIRGKINNLFNAEYSEYGVLKWKGVESYESYYPSPGRNFVIEVGMRY